MRHVFRRRPSASMVVAITALVFTASGTAVAAGRLIGGDKLIKKHSLSGNRLRNHTITGAQVNLGKLGKVPSAKNADHATTANSATTAINATNATNASHATSADQLGKLVYVTTTFVVPVSSRATGSATCPSGTFVTGGGLASPLESGTMGPDYLIDSYPSANRTAWVATVENEDPGSSYTETVWAVCASAAATG